MSLPTTSAEALENARILSGNPHNARQIEKLEALALFAKGKDGTLNARGVATWEAGWEARHPAKELLAAGSTAKPWNRSAARRASRARAALRAA